MPYNLPSKVQGQNIPYTCNFGKFEEAQFDKNGKQIDELVECCLPEKWNEKDLIIAKFRTKIDKLFSDVEIDLEVSKDKILIEYCDYMKMDLLFFNIDNLIEQLQMDMKNHV
jgi:hypothetical protein